jgi:hypothetical protein
MPSVPSVPAQLGVFLAAMLLSGRHWIITFCIGGMILMAINLGQRAEGDEISAYSVFNKDGRALPGQFNAGHIERALRHTAPGADPDARAKARQREEALRKQEEEDLRLAMDQSVRDEEERLRRRRGKRHKARPTTRGRAGSGERGEARSATLSRRTRGSPRAMRHARPTRVDPSDL